MYGNKISEEEINRDWSFSSKDRQLISTINRSNRLWFSIELSGFKLFGQFIENPNELSSSIIGYLCKQLEIPIVATVDLPYREATKTHHKKLIFEYLNFSKFSNALPVFKSWMKKKIDEGFILVDEIYPLAEQFLIQNRIMLPTKYKLKREINSICFQQQELIFNCIYKKIPKQIIPILDQVLEVIEDEQCSWFQKFKEYPGSSTITQLKDYHIKI